MYHSRRQFPAWWRGQEQRGDRLKLTLERHGTRKSLGLFKAKSSGLASHPTSKGPQGREGSFDHPPPPLTPAPTLWSLNSRERAWVSLNLHLWLPFSLACESLEVRDYCHPHRCLRYIIESDSWWVLSKYLLKEQMDGWMDE